MFRPLQIHVYSYLAVTMAACMCAVSIFTLLLQDTVLTQQSSALPYQATQIITLVNQERQKNGLNPLTIDFSLLRASQLKVDDMAAQSYFSHVSPQQQRWSVFIAKSQYRYIEAGENLANGFQNPRDIVYAWLQSPSHRENVLAPQYQDTGIAVRRGSLNGRPTIFVVQMFGIRQSDEVST